MSVRLLHITLWIPYRKGTDLQKQELGTFARLRDVTEPLIYFHNFMEEIDQARYKATSKVLSFKKTKVSEEVTNFLDLEPDTPVVQMDRVRMGDGRPLAFDKTWFPLEYGKLLLTKDLEHKTIYKILEEKFNIPILNGRYQIKAANADANLARHLDVAPNTALLLIDHISCTSGQKKVYYQQRHIRPDKMAYRLFLERPEHTELTFSKEGASYLTEFIPVFHDK